MIFLGDAKENCIVFIILKMNRSCPLRMAGQSGPTKLAAHRLIGGPRLSTLHLSCVHSANVERAEGSVGRSLSRYLKPVTVYSSYT